MGVPGGTMTLVTLSLVLRGGGLGLMPLAFMNDASCSGISAKTSLACTRTHTHTHTYMHIHVHIHNTCGTVHHLCIHYSYNSLCIN